MRAALLAALALFTALPAWSAPAPQPRWSPDQQQAMIDLAYSLGELHALKTVCAGPDVATWRSRMNRMLEIETPDDGFRRKLISSFNAGFASRQAEFPVCRPEADEQAREAANRGRSLARRLSARAP